MQPSGNSIWSTLKADYNLLTILWLLIFSVLASLTTYHYGTGNHAVIVPFLKFIAQPQLYPGDYFVMQQQYYHTFLWDLFAMIKNGTGLSVEWLFFISYIVCIFLSAVAIYGIAISLFERTDVAFLAVFIQIFYFIHNAGIGDEFLIDHLFKESQAALPLLLFAIYSFIRGYYKATYLLLGIAFSIHALTSIYVIAAITVPFIWICSKGGWKPILTPLLILIVIAVPLLVRKFLHSPESMHMFTTYMDWPEMLRARYPGHSFPFSWSVWKYMKAVLVVTLFLYTWRFPPAGHKHQIIKLITYTIFGLWVFGLIFTELVPLPIFIQLQLFRSYTILSLFAVIYWANFLVLRLQSKVPLWNKLAMLFASIGLILFLPSEGSPVIYQIQSSPMVLWKNNYVYIIGFGMLLMGYSWKYKAALPIRYFAGFLMMISVFFYGRKLNKAGVSIYSKQPAEWVDIQHWARTNSAQDALFIVPPQLRGFRVDAERSIFGDYKDGIQMYFNPEFGYEWKHRMQTLGNQSGLCEDNLGQNYSNLKEKQFLEIAGKFKEQHNAIFVVSYVDHEILDFSTTYTNDEFVVYRVH